MEQNKMISQRVRNRHGQICGVLIAVPINDDMFGVGYSMCNMKLDKFNRLEGIKLATDRALNNVVSPKLSDLPHSIKHDYARFEYRARRYFKDRRPVA